MALRFATCEVCNESHALQQNGVMSIHTNTSGERCEGSPPPQDSRRKRREVPPTEEHIDEEREAAFDVAAESKQRRNLDRGLDRRIYVTDRAVVYNGGSPGSRRR